MRLSIPNPCDEKWEEMTPTEQGRHCAACQRNLVDFSSMTDAEILGYVRRSKGKVCGRFRTDQLNREIFAPRPLLPHNWGRWVASIPLAALGLVGAAQAQTGGLPRTEQHEADSASVKQPLTTAQTGFKLLRGRVLDGEVEGAAVGLGFVTVKLVGHPLGAIADEEGYFVIRVPEQINLSGQLVKVSFAGESQDFPLTDKQALCQTEVELLFQNMPQMSVGVLIMDPKEYRREIRQEKKGRKAEGH